MSYKPEATVTIQWENAVSGNYTLKTSREIIATGSFFLNKHREIQAITNEGSGIDDTLCMLHKLVQDGLALAPTVELTQGNPYESVFKSRASLEAKFNPAVAPPVAQPNPTSNRYNMFKDKQGIVTVHNKFQNYNSFIETAAEEERKEQKRRITALPTTSLGTSRT